MGRVLRAIFSGIGITLMLAAVFSLVLWFLGGFFGFGETRPFESVTGRLVGIAVVWVVALLVILILLLRGGRKDEAMAEDIVAAPESAAATPDDEIVREELGEMREKLKQALARLRKSKHGRRNLYELPWYILIGPPGAGKTTAIVNSGLNFPLEDEVGRNAVSGVGGTRNCDWWFAESAVLVDTAGRYTTQESDADADNAAWLGFLGILKKHRPRQPINGAIVAISLADLSQQDEITQKAHAKAVRRRLHELRERLGVRFPVYVLFTKADLIAGFTEFFDNLGKTERGQVWGWTYPLSESTAKRDVSPVETFNREFALLLGRLNEHSIERMQSETDPQRRSLIAGFPLQLASSRQTAQEFIAELFQESRYQHRQLLRGIYFTSGTQEGTPIDRLLMGMARTFGIGRQALGTGQGTGRSYFLTRLFKDVVFPESGLVSADDKVERRYRWTKRAAIAATVLLAIGASSVWVRSYLGNQALAAEVSDHVAAYRQAAADIPTSPIGDSDLPLVVPALNVLRDIPVNATWGEAGVPEGLGWGLYQGSVLGSSSQQAYRTALNQHFLPRLLLRLEEQIQSNVNDPDLLYEALKVYLMLGLAGPMNHDQIVEWMDLDWSISYPGPQRAALRNDLATHLDALLSQPMQEIDLNNDLVEHVQQILTRLPQAQRVYNGIINSAAATELPDWRLTDVGGPAISRAMTRSSGKPLNEGIEGIFTYRGFNEVFLNEALSVAQRIQRDSWVLGSAGEIEQSEATLVAISRDVLGLYYNDFIGRYDQLLSDLDIVPLESLSHAVEVTNVLSGPTSPIVNVLNAVAEETRLTEDRTPAGVEGATEGGGAVGGILLRRKLSPTTLVFLDAMAASAEAAGEEYEPPGKYVEDRFAWLHDLVASQDGQPSQLDQMIELLTAVYQQLNKQVFTGGVVTPDTESSALLEFQQAVASQPGPMQRWSQQIAVGSSGIAAGGTRAGINAQWQANVLPFCEQVTSAGYPFNRRARSDVALPDFARLFAPGGLIDSFFQDNLAKFVDVRGQTWTWKQVNNTDLGISQAVLTQMQHAAEIREAFFGGRQDLAVSFQVTPEALDPKARAISLEIDGQTVAFKHSDGQPRPVAVTWPGSVGLARVSFEPPAQQSESTLSRDGPWAWFRLLNAAELRRTNVSDRKRLIFNVGGRIAIFQMQSSTVHDPFALPALSKFSCPKSF